MKILNFAKQRKFNNQLITGHHILDIKVSPWHVCLDIEIISIDTAHLLIKKLIEYFKNNPNQNTLLLDSPNFYGVRTEMVQKDEPGARMKALTIEAKCALTFVTTDIPDLINIIKYYLNVDIEKFIEDNQN